jgi:hypothetical protein
MNTSMRTRSILTALVVGVAIAPAAPAAGMYAPVTEPQATSQSEGPDLVLRRDGDRAVPFFADVRPEADAATADRTPTELAQRTAGGAQHAAADGSEYASVNAIAPPSSRPASDGSLVADSGYSSANAISAPSTS